MESEGCPCRLMRCVLASSRPLFTHTLASFSVHPLAPADDFNGAMLKAVCVEAGMIALRRSSGTIKHEDFVEGIQAVQMKKKTSLQYYA